MTFSMEELRILLQTRGVAQIGVGSGATPRLVPTANVQRTMTGILAQSTIRPFALSAAQLSATQRSAAQRYAPQRSTAQRNAAQRSSAQRNAARRNSVQRNTAQRCSAQRNVVASDLAVGYPPDPANSCELDVLPQFGLRVKAMRLASLAGGADYVHCCAGRTVSQKHTDGSFSAFGTQDSEDSTWLTSFVLRALLLICLLRTGWHDECHKRYVCGNHNFVRMELGRRQCHSPPTHQWDQLCASEKCKGCLKRGSFNNPFA
jgi:hypothetical protein